MLTLPRLVDHYPDRDFRDRRLQTCRLAGGYGHNLRPDLAYTLSVGRSAFGVFANPTPAGG